MKKIIFILISAVFVFALVLCFVNIGKGNDDVNHCLVKYKSEWNKPCIQCKEYSQSYRAYFRNECNEKIDVKCAAQESDKRWRTFTRLEMLPNDTIVAYACKGSGKYMKWVRKTGDTTAPFPSDDEINDLYGK